MKSPLRAINVEKAVSGSKCHPHLCPRLGVSSGVAELHVPPLHQAPDVGYIQLHFPVKNLGLDLAEGRENSGVLPLLSPFHPPHFPLILLSTQQCVGCGLAVLWASY